MGRGETERKGVYEEERGNKGRGGLSLLIVPFGGHACVSLAGSHFLTDFLSEQVCGFFFYSFKNPI